MARLATFSGKLFQWKSRKGSAHLPHLPVVRFPEKGFYVQSHRTNELQLFLPDAEDMEANEFYDGEARTYFAPGTDIRITIWVD